MAVGWGESEGGHISVVISSGICCSVSMHSSKGDSLSEVMEQKLWKQSSEGQTDTLVLCLDRCIVSKVHRCFGKVSGCRVFSGSLFQTLHTSLYYKVTRLFLL